MELTREFIEANKGKRFNVELEDGTILNKIEFFISASGYTCYKNSKQKRRGRLFPYSWNIKSISESKKVEHTKEKNAKTILNRIHKNAWTEIQDSFKEFINGGEEPNEFQYHFDGKLNFRSITSLLNKHEQERLKDAFENKTEYRWSKNTYHHRGRDLSLSCRVCEDGIFRAWFSSEYMGCGNGDYYLLLSPTTAIYYEAD